MGLLSGCWLQLGADAGHTRFNFVEIGLTVANVDTLQVDWSVPLGGVPSEPVVSGDRLYLTRTTGPDTGRSETGVQARRIGTGALVWDQELGEAGGLGPWISGTPVTFVGDELWSGHESLSPVNPTDPPCEAGSDVLDPATGAKTTVAGAFPSAAVSSGAVVARILTELSDTCPSQPVASSRLEVDSRPPHAPGSRWTAEIGGVSVPAPTIAGDHVYMPTRRGSELRLEAYEAAGCGAATCPPVWSTPFTQGLSTAVARDTGPVFVLSANTLHALDQDTGAVLWRGSLEASPVGLALAGGKVFVVTAARVSGLGLLQAFDAGGCGGQATCSRLWYAELGGPTSVRPAEPVVAGGVVYTASSRGVLAFDADGCDAPSCSPLVTVPLPHTDAPKLSVAQARVFVATGSYVDSGESRLTALAPTTRG